ncbi:MAG: YbaB/EbfC family nucleoid-associated protein [Patescibacteria group bacterium]
MFNKLKQFKDLRDKAKNLQTNLAQEKAEGTAGWGKVKVTMDGNQRVATVTIDPDVMNDKNKLEEMIKEATNDAIGKIQKILSGKLKDLGGLDLAKDLQDMMGK